MYKNIKEIVEKLNSYKEWEFFNWVKDVTDYEKFVTKEKFIKILEDPNIRIILESNNSVYYFTYGSDFSEGKYDFVLDDPRIIAECIECFNDKHFYYFDDEEGEHYFDFNVIDAISDDYFTLSRRLMTFIDYDPKKIEYILYKGKFIDIDRFLDFLEKLEYGNEYNFLDNVSIILKDGRIVVKDYENPDLIWTYADAGSFEQMLIDEVENNELVSMNRRFVDFFRSEFKERKSDVRSLCRSISADPFILLNDEVYDSIFK